MNFRNTTEQRMAATFAHHILRALFNEKDGNAKLKQSFPTSTFMETDTANIKSLKVDGVVFLIRNMGHSMYYKVMQSNQFAELPKIYCNSRNINNIYQAMLLSMKG